MKNLKSLQVAAVAGVAIALTAGCSSTGSTRSTTSNDSGSKAAYQWASASGFTPLTDVRYLGLYPQNWNPVSYESYIFTVPAPEASASVNVGSSGSTISGSASSSDVVVTTDSGARTTTQFNTDLQPGDTFVEAAGGRSDGQVRRVILYSPMQGYIGGFAQ